MTGPTGPGLAVLEQRATSLLHPPTIQEPGHPANLTAQAQAFSHKNGLGTGTLETGGCLPAPCRSLPLPADGDKL